MNRGNLCALAAGADGCIVMLAPDSDVAEAYVINPNVVRRAIAEAWRAFNQYTAQDVVEQEIDKIRCGRTAAESIRTLHEQVVVNTAIHNLGNARRHVGICTWANAVDIWRRLAAQLADVHVFAAPLVIEAFNLDRLPEVLAQQLTHRIKQAARRHGKIRNKDAAVSAVERFENQIAKARAALDEAEQALLALKRQAASLILDENSANL